MKKYWVSFNCSVNLMENFEMHSPWWISGSQINSNYEITSHSICCAIQQPNKREVYRYVRSCFDKGYEPKRIKYRFIDEKPNSWSPFCDRFPKAKWMKWK